MFESASVSVRKESNNEIFCDAHLTNDKKQYFLILFTETPADLDDNKKRWLVVGICLHSVIAPALRECIAPILTVLYSELKGYFKIDTQIYQKHLEKYPPTNFSLNYGAVNNNKQLYHLKKAKYDFSIKNAVDLSKLFLPTHMAQYTGFDETFETSGLLELVTNIDKFAPDVRLDAGNVRKIFLEF